MKIRTSKNTPEDNEYIRILIKEGELMYGSSDAEGNLVLDYVQTRLEAEGKRIKVPLVPGPLVGYNPFVEIINNKKGEIWVHEDLNTKTIKKISTAM